jgi:hypothetical protein
MAVHPDFTARDDRHNHPTPERQATPDPNLNVKPGSTHPPPRRSFVAGPAVMERLLDRGPCEPKQKRRGDVDTSVRDVGVRGCRYLSRLSLGAASKSRSEAWDGFDCVLDLRR